MRLLSRLSSSNFLPPADLLKLNSSRPLSNMIVFQASKLNANNVISMVVDGGQSAMLKVAPAGRLGPTKYCRVGSEIASCITPQPPSCSPPTCQVLQQSQTLSPLQEPAPNMSSLSRPLLFFRVLVFLDMLRFSRRPNSSLERKWNYKPHIVFNNNI